MIKSRKAKIGVFFGMCSIAAKINLYLLELVGKLVFKSEVASLRIVNLCALLIKYISVFT